MMTTENRLLPILLVDDEEQILLSAQTLLRTAGFSSVLTLSDSHAVLPMLAEQEIGVVVLDIGMPVVSGCDLLVDMARDYPHIPVIFMTAMNDLDTAVSCMRGGAFDYLLKPVEKSRFVTAVRRALEVRLLQSELLSLKNRLLSDELNNSSAFADIITRNKKMRAIFQYVEVISGTHQPVLITGETGVGKELIARSIHTASGLQGGFIPVNSAGLDDTMFSDALFGHKKGAFTGAEAARDGMIAQAAGGTLFLDEIGDMSESSQVKILRLMQERTYHPLGSDIPRQSDARVLVATNRDIQALIASGQFRKDLYYRLRAHHIHIPPLRERAEDIPLLLLHFLELSAKLLQKKTPHFPPELVVLLQGYRFPGNVRELQLMAFDAVVQSKGGMISQKIFRDVIGEEKVVHHISFRDDGWKRDFLKGESAGLPTLKEAEEFLVEEALRNAGGNQGAAASMLGISRQALNKRLSRRQKP
ncbi:MAG TPA: sigma-54 dependent transcriptional regulator [Dissulfurispiraceae bacterium]|nr:sigma-54 dependent transcriptional regulator [Dissulfurispiraceae bacterium]